MNFSVVWQFFYWGSNTGQICHLVLWKFCPRLGVLSLHPGQVLCASKNLSVSWLSVYRTIFYAVSSRPSSFPYLFCYRLLSGIRVLFYWWSNLFYYLLCHFFFRTRTELMPSRSFLCRVLGIWYLNFFPCRWCADPYLNTDAGTMSPFEHGEVFVLDDGGEVRLTLHTSSSSLLVLCSLYTSRHPSFTLDNWTF